MFISWFTHHKINKHVTETNKTKSNNLQYLNIVFFIYSYKEI